jgi:uncharacterized membrane protein
LAASTIRRRSLDAVDRNRTRLWIAIIALAVLLVFVFVHGAWAGRGGRETTQAILAHYFMLLIRMTALTLIVILQITVMTKRILRAIDLASRK